MPPENWCGKSPRRLAAAGMPTRSSSSIGPSPRLAAAHAEVDPQRLGELVAHRQHRVQGGHRVLEDESHPGSPHAPQFVRVEADQVFPVETGPAGHDLGRRHGQELEHRHHGHALSRAALAHHPEQLSLAHVEADAVDGVNGAVPGVEAGTDVLDLEDGTACRCFDRGAHRTIRPPSGEASPRTDEAFAQAPAMFPGAPRTNSGPDSRFTAARRLGDVSRPVESCAPAPPPRRTARRSSAPSRPPPRAGSCPARRRSWRRRPRGRSRCAD